MKAIMISIKPKYVADILNGEKTIEIRKTCPALYSPYDPIDVYIYCTKEDSNGYLIKNRSTNKCEFTFNGFIADNCWCANGKVVAKFTLNKVSPLTVSYYGENGGKEILEKSCLTYEELLDYKTKHISWDRIFAWHIDNLVIFDKPKQIRDFVATKFGKPVWKPVNRPPQSWSYIETEE